MRQTYSDTQLCTIESLVHSVPGRLCTAVRLQYMEYPVGCVVYCSAHTVQVSPYAASQVHAVPRRLCTVVRIEYKVYPAGCKVRLLYCTWCNRCVSDRSLLSSRTERVYWSWSTVQGVLWFIYSTGCTRHVFWTSWQQKLSSTTLSLVHSLWNHLKIYKFHKLCFENISHYQ